MNYIYDVVLNFNKEFYEYFEWNKKDNIVNIKKIPIFNISNDIFLSMKYDYISISHDFIQYIKDKTYTYNRQKIGNACLLSNRKQVIGVIFNDKGELIKRSSLLLDEEEEVLDEIGNDKFTNITIIRNKKSKTNYSISRHQRERSKFLIDYIKKEDNYINLKYLYYDYYEKDEDSIDIIKKTLISEIKDNWNNKCDSFYNTVKLFTNIKKVST